MAIVCEHDQTFAGTWDEHCWLGIELPPIRGKSGLDASLIDVAVGKAVCGSAGSII